MAISPPGNACSKSITRELLCSCVWFPWAMKALTITSHFRACPENNPVLKPWGWILELEILRHAGALILLSGGVSAQQVLEVGVGLEFVVWAVEKALFAEFTIWGSGCCQQHCPLMGHVCPWCRSPGCDTTMAWTPEPLLSFANAPSFIWGD